MKNNTFLPSRLEIIYWPPGLGSGRVVRDSLRANAPPPAPPLSASSGSPPSGPATSSPESAVLSSTTLSSAISPTPHLRALPTPSGVPTHTSRSCWFQPTRALLYQNESQVGFHPAGFRSTNQSRSFNGQLTLICLRPPRLQATVRWARRTPLRPPIGQSP